MAAIDPSALERDTLRLAVRALAELVAGPARAKHELFASLLGELCALAGASGALAAERAGRGPQAKRQRVIAAIGPPADRQAPGEELEPSEALARAGATFAPACGRGGAEAAPVLAIPLHARGELIGSIALERASGEFTADEAAALAAFAEAAGEILLGYERAGLRARAEEDLVRSQRHLRRGAPLDGLTGLATRVATQRAVADAAERSQAAGLPLAVIAIDIDDAKALADRIGAERFDEAIADTARALRETVRPSDWTGRWGVDSFLVTLLACNAESAAIVAERIRLRIEGASARTWEGEELALTVSAGVASTGLAREEAPDLTARALRALEEAKRAGRNRVCVSRPARA